MMQEPSDCAITVCDDANRVPQEAVHAPLQTIVARGRRGEGVERVALER
jgi:hypothetical protein